MYSAMDFVAVEEREDRYWAIPAVLATDMFYI